MGAKKRRTPTTPTKPKETPQVGPPPVGPPSEFRNLGDDAWYSVHLALQGETLTVKYREFPEEQDEVFHAEEFTTPDEVSLFRGRFRALGEQLEGRDCGRVKEGMRVCGIRVFGENDRRFYDAFVDAVKRGDHSVVDGIENCSCCFVLAWLHGPLAGKITLARIEDLCLIKFHAQLDPRLVCFLEITKWKHGIASHCAGLFSEDITSNQRTQSSSFKHKHAGSGVQISEGHMQTKSALFYNEDSKFGFERNEDVDLGGHGSNNANLRQNDSRYSVMVNDLVDDVSGMDLKERDCAETKVADEDARYFILIENMEKDVSPATIIDFVHKATCLEIEAFVFLSLSSDPFSRGALVIDSAEEHERLYNFLLKPDQMIISSRGRPWIVSDSAAPELVRPSFWCLEPDLKVTSSCDISEEQHASDELKVVSLGSEEYDKAKRLRDLFLEFTGHQRNLVKRLALEEELILAT